MSTALTALAVIGLLLIVILCTISGCTEHTRARAFGGTTLVHLPPNQKLIHVTWKEGSDLWYLTRPMREGEKAETYQFKEDSNFGLMNGTVILDEQ